MGIASSLDKSQLIAALRRGDERAFMGLVEAHQATLLRLARMYVTDLAVAEDVVQETWLGVLRGPAAPSAVQGSGHAGAVLCTRQCCMMSLPEMPCQEIVEVITEYLEGTLPEPDHTRFEEHLAVCEPCVLYLEQMREMIAVLGEIDSTSLSPATEEKLLSLFRDWKSGGE